LAKIISIGVPAVRILIVEDEPLIALDLQAIVEGEGHEVVAMHNSVAGARGSLSCPPDFALLDIDVKDGKSFDLASELEARRIPFAFVSGSRQAEVPDHLRAARFIPKPYRDQAIIGSLPVACGTAAHC
jgi:DNA-binding response OmpR family regulator